jgi:hypothetical protein
MLLTLAAALAAPPILLDAGSLASEVADGFSRLDLEGSADARVAWLTPPQRALAGTFPDPLTGDALLGGQLRLDLPPGTWHIAALMGSEEPNAGEVVAAWGLTVRSGATASGLWVDPPDDWASFRATPAYTAVARPHYTPGSTAWDRVVAPSKSWLRGEVQVTGPLVLAPQGRPLAALILTQDDPSPLLARVDAWRRDTFHARWSPADEPPPPDWAAEPLTLATASWEQPPDPALATATPALRLAAAPGERQGRVLWAPGDAPITWTVRGAPDLSVETYEVVWADTTAAVRPRALRPSWLVPSPSRAEGGQGLPVGVAVVLSTPPGAKPGLRRATLTLRRGDQMVEVPLTLDVRRVTLPPLPFPAGFIAQVSPLATALDGYGSDTVVASIEADMDRMRLLGADLISLRFLLSGSGWPTTPAPEASKLAEAAWAAWHARGGRLVVWPDPKTHVRPTAYLNPETAPLPAELVRSLGELLTAVGRAPIEVVVPFWEEEGGWKNAGAPDRARALVPQLRAVAPDVRFGATAAHPVDWGVAGTFDVVMTSTMPLLDRATIDHLRAAGSAPWAYNLPPGRSGPLMAWASGADAFLQWHWSPSVDDPFNDVHASFGSWYAAHGPDGQVWHSALAERFAQGLSDVRWLAALDEAIAAAPRSRQADVARAVKLREAIRASLDAALPTSTWDAEALDPAALDDLSAAVRAAVERLRR